MTGFIRLNNGEPHVFGEPFTPCIESIAGALSHINRFNGHVGVYSVAQHSVLVAMQLPVELRLSGLLHDGTEAYLGDVTSPLKAMLPEYKKLEQKYHHIIDTYYGVDTKNNLVREVDLRMLLTEAVSFNLGTEGFPAVEPYKFVIKRQTPDEAYKSFLELFYALT